ncbi:Kinase [Hexamita inflata]|uniref:CAMK CAMKL n=1 Tax=Hexamita inflata TaxID=28002 RepID=A0AA86N4J2_9EUKA|nr:CAMK CAMKL [Hexamita inflata]
MQVTITNSNVIKVQDYKINKMIAVGSFVTCFSAYHPIYKEVALLLAYAKDELQKRYDIACKYSNIHSIQRIYEIKELIIEPSQLNIINNIYPAIFCEKQYILTGELYSMTYSQYMLQLTTDQSIQFFQKVLTEVYKMHQQNLFHMDLKPSNIFVVNDQPIFADFGQAVCEYVKQKQVENTSAYAPKHDVYKCDVDPRAFDVYCLGAMLYEIILEQPPINPIEPFSCAHLMLRNKIGQVASDILSKMLCKNQKYRVDLKYCINHPLFLNEKSVHVLIKYQLLNDINIDQHYTRDLCDMPNQIIKIPDDKVDRCSIFRPSSCSSIQEVEVQKANDDMVNIYSERKIPNIQQIIRIRPHKIKTQFDFSMIGLIFVLEMQEGVQINDCISKIETSSLIDESFAAPMYRKGLFLGLPGLCGDFGFFPGFEPKTMNRCSLMKQDSIFGQQQADIVLEEWIRHSEIMTESNDQ